MRRIVASDYCYATIAVFDERENRQEGREGGRSEWFAPLCAGAKIGGATSQRQRPPSKFTASALPPFLSILRGNAPACPGLYSAAATRFAGAASAQQRVPLSVPP